MKRLDYGQARVLENRISDATLQTNAMAEHVGNALLGNSEYEPDFIVKQCQNLIEKAIQIQREALTLKEID